MCVCNYAEVFQCHSRLLSCYSHHHNLSLPPSLSLSLSSLFSLPLPLSSPFHRKPTNQITDADQLERGGGRENGVPSSQVQSQMTAIELSTVSPNLAAMMTDLEGITTSTHPQPVPIQGMHSQHTQMPPSSMAMQQDMDQTLNLPAAAVSSSTNRPVRPSDLRIPGQNGAVVAHKKKPFGRSVSLDLPPRQQTLNHHMRS